MPLSELPVVRGYSRLTIVMHWLTVVLLIAIYASIEGRVLFERGSETREFVKSLHMMLGMSVIIVVLIRLYGRMTSTKPVIAPALSTWELRLSRLMHASLYAFLLIMPLLGWLFMSAFNRAVPFFGLELPILLDENKNLGSSLKEIHETLGVVGYWLIGLHAVAGLYHHYVKRDNALVNILKSR